MIDPLAPDQRVVGRVPANEHGRDFVVGDIHGCTSEFRNLLRQVSFNKGRDRVFSVGDLIDRGPDSVRALSFLYEPWFFAVKGNHEQMFLDALEGPADGSLWLYNGGSWYFTLDAASQTMVKDMLPRLRELPLAIVVGDGADRFNVVHAQFVGTDADLDAGQVNELLCLWGRDVVHDKLHDFIGYGLSPTYCGHTILRGIARKANHVFIDTGAFVAHGDYETPIDARLTMIEPKTGNVWEARKPTK